MIRLVVDIIRYANLVLTFWIAPSKSSKINCDVSRIGMKRQRTWPALTWEDEHII